MSLIGARVGGGLFTTWSLANRDNTPNVPATGVNLHCRVVGSLSLEFASIHGEVRLEGMSLIGRIDARHLSIQGDLILRGSVIGAGRVDFGDWGNDHTDARFIEAEAKRPSWGAAALDLELAEVHGNLWLQNTRVLGDIQADKAEIVGEMNMDGGVVHGNLMLRQAKVDGRVFADETRGATAYPKVSGTIDLSFAMLKQVDVKFDPSDDQTRPVYLNLTGANVSTLTLRGALGDPKTGGTTIGTDDLTFSTLDVSELTCGKKPPSNWRDKLRIAMALGLFGLCLSFAIISRSVGTCMLVAGVALGVAAWRSVARRILENQREEIGKKERNDAQKMKQSLLGLLQLTYPFNPGFYKQVEAWLRRDGNDALADEVFLCSRKRDNDAPSEVPKRIVDIGKMDDVRKESDARGSIVRQAGMMFLDISMGYGARPGRLLKLWLLMGLLTVCVFSSRHSVERPIGYGQPRTDTVGGRGMKAELPGKKVVDNPWPADGGRPGAKDHWGTGRALFMAMRVQVPFLSMASESDWEPASRMMTRKSWTWVPAAVTFENYAALVSALNLLVIPLTIAGLAGLLKRDK